MGVWSDMGNGSYYDLALLPDIEYGQITGGGRA